MRHRAKVQTFGLATDQRKGLLRGLVTSLVEHGRIKTTLARAKELRRHVERAVTTAQGPTPLHARRLLLSRYPNQDTVDTLMTSVGPRMAKRAKGSTGKAAAGGYTRILKLGKRPGDNADMAYIEFVDYSPKGEKTEAEVKVEAKAKKVRGVKAAAKKKGIRKKQRADRRVRRANHA